MRNKHRHGKKQKQNFFFCNYEGENKQTLQQPQNHEVTWSAIATSEKENTVG